MIDFKISKEVKEVCTNMALGLLKADVEVKSSSDSLIKEIDDLCASIVEKLAIEELTADLRIKNGREAYKALGKSPSKYRLSSEALIRRVLQGKGLYRVNNIVDINNLISIKSKFPVGSYDLTYVNYPVVLNKAKEGDVYRGIGKDTLNIENLPVLSDSEGPFGSPTSDSVRAMIKGTSKEIVLCIYSFSGRNNLEIYLNYAKELLEKYAQGKNFEISVVFE
ncbi:B3/B4 domain-containing protein [Clostridium butyricum]|uniref:B3/B4 domain-containing protein n=1 Tax=Clostridium butyricum TaxID=1492 RepID=UPI00374ED0FA